MSIAKRKDTIQIRKFQLSELRGYNEELESTRQEVFREFNASCNIRKQRKLLASLASFTSLRSAEFINSFDKALGLR